MTGARYALLNGGRNDLLLQVDPRAGEETLHRLEKAMEGTMFREGLWRTSMAAQPIGRAWWDRPSADLVAEHERIAIENPAGEQIRIVARSRLRARRAATCALLKEKAARDLIGRFFVARRFFEELFDEPYPFRDFTIIEINDWGFGQAPPGIIFYAKEFYTAPVRARPERPVEQSPGLRPEADALGRKGDLPGRPERPRELCWESTPPNSRGLSGRLSGWGLSQGIGLRPQPWAGLCRPVGPGQETG